MVSQEALGVQQATSHTLKIKGNYIFSVDAASMQTFKIDPTKNPKTIDLIHAPLRSPLFMQSYQLLADFVF